MHLPAVELERTSCLSLPSSSCLSFENSESDCYNLFGQQSRQRLEQWRNKLDRNKHNHHVECRHLYFTFLDTFIICVFNLPPRWCLSYFFQPFQFRVIISATTIQVFVRKKYFKILILRHLKQKIVRKEKKILFRKIQLRTVILIVK